MVTTVTVFVSKTFQKRGGKANESFGVFLLAKSVVNGANIAANWTILTEMCLTFSKCLSSNPRF